MFLPILSFKNILVEKGRVADYCPICLAITPFEYEEYRQEIYLFWLIPQEPPPHTCLTTCCRCQLHLSAVRSTYAAVSQQTHDDLDALVAETHPMVREKYGRQLDFIERARANALPQPARREYIREMFSLVNQTILRGHGHKKRPPFWDLTALWPVAVILLLILAGNLWLPNLKPYVPLGVVLTLILAAISFIRGLLKINRQGFHEGLAYLSAAFAPIHPSAQELQDVMDELDRIGYNLSATFTAQGILHAIDLRTAPNT